MAGIIGNRPDQISSSGMAGTMSFQSKDVVNITGGSASLSSTTTQNLLMDTPVSVAKPTLNLDFAGSKVLDPRITFTRSSSASYYDGSLTMAEQNLLTYSEQFDNAAWVKSSATATANATTAPDGTLTAAKLYENVTNNRHELELNNPLSISSGVSYTFSIYLKSAERRYVFLSHSGLNTEAACFDLQTGTITHALPGISRHRSLIPLTPFLFHEISCHRPGQQCCTAADNRSAAYPFGRTPVSKAESRSRTLATGL